MPEPRNQEQKRKNCKACKRAHNVWHFDVDPVTLDYEQQCIKSKKRKPRKPRVHPYSRLSERDRVAYSIKLLYGLSIERYDELRQRQNYCCAICGLHESESVAGGRSKNAVRRLHVDHDHRTGEVRGLLCRSCNHMIGNAADDPARLRAGIEYLRRWALARITAAEEELRAS